MQQAREGTFTESRLKMITASQIRKIHVLKDVLGLDDSDYRAIFSGFDREDLIVIFYYEPKQLKIV